MHRLTPWLRHLAFLALMSVASGWAAAQPAPEAAAETYSQEELDQILAPVALYPDTLLMQVLAAATYPLEIVEAERFIRANPKLKGEAMTRAAANKEWDLSVISLLQFPSVLTMMNDKLDWTQQLGDVFLGQQPDVMNTVQALRARAQQAGNLVSTAQQQVVVQEKIIVIQPAQPQVVYVPYYNPTVVYGPWWAPARPPWYWQPPPMYRPPSLGEVVAAGIFWGVAISIRNDIWNDYRPSWRDGRITVVNNVTIVNVNVNRRPPPGGDWRHDPVHRKGVSYRNNAVRDRVLEGSSIRPPPRPPTGPARPGAIGRLPSRGDDDQLRPRPSAGIGTNTGTKPDVRPGLRPDARPAAATAARPAARPAATPAAMPAATPAATPDPRPAARPSSRPAPQPHSPPAQFRPSNPISPGATRDVVNTQADRGRASREAVGQRGPAGTGLPASSREKPTGVARPAPVGR